MSTEVAVMGVTREGDAYVTLAWSNGLIEMDVESAEAVARAMLRCVGAARRQKQEQDDATNIHRFSPATGGPRKH